MNSAQHEVGATQRVVVLDTLAEPASQRTDFVNFSSLAVEFYFSFLSFHHFGQTVLCEISAFFGFLIHSSASFVNLQVCTPAPLWAEAGWELSGAGGGDIFFAFCVHDQGPSVPTRPNRMQRLPKLASNLLVPRAPGTQESPHCHLVDIYSNITWNGAVSLGLELLA